MTVPARRCHGLAGTQKPGTVTLALRNPIAQFNLEALPAAQIPRSSNPAPQHRSSTTFHGSHAIHSPHCLLFLRRVQFSGQDTGERGRQSDPGGRSPPAAKSREHPLLTPPGAPQPQSFCLECGLSRDPLSAGKPSHPRRKHLLLRTFFQFP